MAEHDKLKWVRRIREATDRAFLKLPLPNIKPNIISGLSILTSMLFILVLKYSLILAFILIIATLLLDWLDGLVAKKRNSCSEEGYMVDVVSDRLSEGIMLIPFFVPWFYLFALNSILTLLSFAKSRHIIIPLRHLFLVYFLFAFFL